MARSMTLFGITLALALMISPARPDDVKRLFAHQAGEHLGEMALVCGVIASTRYAHQSRGAPTYLNFDKPYPENDFTVVVWGEDRDNFPYKPEDLKDHHACVYGRIDDYRGKPQIVAMRPEQILHKPAESSEPAQGQP
jgi:hypothetical protein